MLLDIDCRLTRDKTDALASQTHAGMAFFGGTGPQDKTCRECQFWKDGPRQYYAAGSSRGQTLKPTACQKYRKMTGKAGMKVPHNARACKYFVQDEKPPKVYSDK